MIEAILWSHTVKLVVALLLLAPLAACMPGKDLPPLPPYHAEAYRLGVGDSVRLITFGEEQLSGEFRVDDTGRIAVPLLGSVTVDKLTSDQLAKKVASELKVKNFLRNPSVAVEIISYRPVFVLGEVTRPGEYPYRPGMTTLTAVAIAGGFTYRGVQDYASVIRIVTNGKPIEGLVDPGSFIAPGDVIKVFERRF